MLFIGLDLSPTHSGAVLLDENYTIFDHQFAFASTVARPKKKDVPGAHRIQLSPHSYRAILEVQRLGRHAESVLSWVDSYHSPGELIVGIEDYAYDAKGRAHAAGEIGGMVRSGLFTRRIPFRAYDPLSLKIVACGKGVADKHMVAAGIAAGYPLAHKALSVASSSPDMLADLLDAYVLARIAATEWSLRAGHVLLDSVTAGERRLFLRTTKARPENILSLPWVADAD